MSEQVEHVHHWQPVQIKLGRVYGGPGHQSEEYVNSPARCLVVCTECKSHSYFDTEFVDPHAHIVGGRINA